MWTLFCTAVDRRTAHGAVATNGQKWYHVAHQLPELPTRESLALLCHHGIERTFGNRRWSDCTTNAGCPPDVGGSERPRKRCGSEDIYQRCVDACIRDGAMPTNTLPSILLHTAVNFAECAMRYDPRLPDDRVGAFTPVYRCKWR